MHAQKRTLAIASATDAHQLPAVLAMASRVMRAAKSINNTPSMALFGTGLSDVRPSAVKNVALLKRISETGWGDRNGPLVDKVDVVVGAHDLAMLRLMPSSRLGEVCAVPKCEDVLCSVPPDTSDFQRREVEATIECLLRPPAVKYESTRDLPLEWREHVENLSSFRWVQDLWAQSLDDLSEEPDDTEVHADTKRPSPFDVLSLCMYCKLASIAFRTTDMAQSVLKSVVVAVDGAVDAGLLSVFPQDGVAPRFLEFVDQYLLGDDYPWQMTAKGAQAAAKARVVMDRTFAHCNRLASVLSISSLALSVKDDMGPASERASESILLVQGGPAGDVAKLLTDRLPAGAEAVDGKFRVAFTPSKPEEWTDELNRAFRSAVDALASAEPPAKEGEGAKQDEDAAVRARIAAYAALSSSHLAIDDSTKDRTFSSALLPASRNVVSTYPPGAASHVSRELVVRKEFMTTQSTMASVSLQPGLSIGCTFVTFCPTMSKTLSTDGFDANSFSSSDLSASHATIERIAASLDSPSLPLGSLTGILGGVVAIDGKQHRVAFWRRRATDQDAFVTFLPKSYVDLAFADYATGSRALDPDELHAHAKLPFFAADSIVTLFTKLAISGSDGMAFRIPSASRLPTLDGDKEALYDAYQSGINAGAKHGRPLALPPALASGMQTFLVRESANDRLAGLNVAWARRSVRGGAGAFKNGRMAVLVSANAASESVAF
jgi:hypothetical protein